MGIQKKRLSTILCEKHHNFLQTHHIVQKNPAIAGFLINIQAYLKA